MSYVQFESVGNFIPEPRCSKFDVGLQMRGSKTGGARGSVGLWIDGPRETGAPTCAKYSSVCSVGIVRIIGCSSRSSPSFGESASPFIDEGHGFTRERAV